jgi:hypothetical protein
MKGQELSISGFFEFSASLLGLCEDYNFLITVCFNEGLHMLHHRLFVLDHYSLVDDSFGYLICVIADKINQYGVIKTLFS